MKKTLWWTLAVVLALALAGVVAFGVVQQRALGELHHAPPLDVTAPEPALVPATPAEWLPGQEESLMEALAARAADPALGEFGVRIRDGATGDLLLDRGADTLLRPASSTKVLTAVAAIAELGPEDRIATAIVRGDAPGSVVIRAAGDVWITEEELDRVAAELAETPGGAATVAIDTSVWPDETILPGWDPKDIDAGYIAPLEPAMINGARIGAAEGEAPRSHTPAADVGMALAERLGAEYVGGAMADPAAEPVATMMSPTLAERISAMMLHSDNVMAEAIGREVALARGAVATSAGATQTTLAVLEEHGFDTSGTVLMDNSGLSVDNRIAPALLESIMFDAITRTDLRSLIGTLPVAGGSGTLVDRFGGLPGRGWVRAKTGTLTDTSALAGVVTSVSGRTMSFALISNGTDVPAARRATDELVSLLREA